MDPKPSHIIGRKVLEIKGLKQSDAKEVQNRIAHLFKEKIIPLLDQHLSTFSPGPEPIQIDRLELDLGNIALDHLEEDWIDRLTVQLHTHFPPRPLQNSISNTTTQKPGKVAPSENAKQPNQQALALFRYFIETGNLPWWADTASGDLVNKSVTFIISNHSIELQKLIKKRIEQPSILQRIVRQLSFANWVKLAAVNTKLKSDDLEVLITELLALLKATPPWQNISVHKLREQVGEQFIRWVYLSNNQQSVTPAFWAGFILELALRQRVKYEPTLSALYQASKDSQTQQPSKSSPSLAQHLAAIWKEQQSNKGAKSASPYQVMLQERLRGLIKTKGLPPATQRHLFHLEEQLGSKLLSQKEAQEISKILSKIEITLSETTLSETTISQNDTFNDTDELFVSNAGLVISWPYLDRFFGLLGLLQDKQFKDTASAHRAVGLLQFLVDGQEVPAEYECGLNKILCGLASDEVLDFGEPVTDTEKAACEDLLRGVIANAPILNDMSIDGFRGSFLLRQGILRAGMGVWRLQVESQTYDIVLERFPWSWNMVKLPWMDLGMMVEWGEN